MDDGHVAVAVEVAETGAVNRCSEGQLDKEQDLAQTRREDGDLVEKPARHHLDQVIGFIPSGGTGGPPVSL